MRIAELMWCEARGWSHPPTFSAAREANVAARKIDLVLYFGIRETLAIGARYEELRAMFPDAHIVGCSTGGQIHNDDVSDDEIAAALISFDSTKIQLACEPAASPAQSRDCGAAIGRKLAASDLAGIFVL